MSYKSKYFRIDEYRCKCGCGLISMHDEALKKFDDIRVLYGKPMIVTSGCRCKEHNEKVGGAKSSAHVPQGNWCYAFDIECQNSKDRFSLIQAALLSGATRIGIAKTFVHIDFAPNLDQLVIWVY